MLVEWMNEISSVVNIEGWNKREEQDKNEYKNRGKWGEEEYFPFEYSSF